MPDPHIAYLRRVLAADPEVEPGVTVVNIDVSEEDYRPPSTRAGASDYAQQGLRVDLSDGTTIHLTIRRETR